MLTQVCFHPSQPNPFVKWWVSDKITASEAWSFEQNLNCMHEEI